MHGFFHSHMHWLASETIGKSLICHVNSEINFDRDVVRSTAGATSAVAAIVTIFSHSINGGGHHLCDSFVIITISSCS